MATLKDAAETGTFGFVLVAAGWIVNQFRRTTNDTESRAGRTVAAIEEDLVQVKADLAQAHEELKRCHAEHHSKDQLLARMERALILAGIPIPD